MKELNSNQFILVAIFATLSTKLLTMQPIVFMFSGKDSFWSILIGAIFDFLVLILVVFVLKKHKNITFFELLKKTFGTVVSKILLCIFTVFITFKLLFLSQETFSFFMRFLYDDLNLFVYIIPLLFVTGYFAVKGITTISRTMEVFSIFILIGLLVCSVTAVVGIDFDYLKPFFEDGISPVLNGFLAQCFFRGNALILLCFMGKIDFSKHFNLKFFICTIIMTMIIIGINLIFFLSYKDSAKYVEFTLANLPQFNPFVSDIGRFNWLSVVVATIALLLTSSTFLFCLSLIGRWVFGLKRALIPVSISHAILVIVAFLNQFSILVMEQKITSWWMYVTGGIGILFLILTFIFLSLRRQEWTKQQNTEL